MALMLMYLMFAKLLGWMALRIRSDTTKDIEILVLRHQLAVLQRHTARLRMSRADRAPPPARHASQSLAACIYAAQNLDQRPRLSRVTP
jgi:hypothetical protein